MTHTLSQHREKRGEPFAESASKKSLQTTGVNCRTHLPIFNLQLLALSAPVYSLEHLRVLVIVPAVVVAAAPATAAATAIILQADKVTFKVGVRNAI